MGYNLLNITPEEFEVSNVMPFDVCHLSSGEKLDEAKGLFFETPYSYQAVLLVTPLCENRAELTEWIQSDPSSTLQSLALQIVDCGSPCPE